MQEFELLQKTIVVPNYNIVYENKSALLKPESLKRQWFIQFKPIAAAASVVIALLMFGWLLQKQSVEKSNKVTQTEPIVSTTIVPKVNLIPDPLLTPVKPIVPSVPLQRKTVASITPKPKQAEIKIETIDPSRIAQVPQPLSPIENPSITDTSRPLLTAMEYLPAAIPSKEYIPLPSPPMLVLIPNTAHARSIAMDATHQPKLFKALNSIVRIKTKVRRTVETISNMDVVVSLGPKIQFNINQ
jgi:hypothetical protein